MQEIIYKREVEEEKVAEIRELMHVMLNGDTYTSLQASKALGAVGAPAVGPLMRALTAVDSDARWVVAMALARVGNDAVEPLIGVVETADDAITNPAAWALAEIGDPRAVDPLIAVLRDNLRSACCRALSAAALLKLGDPTGIARVQEAFDLLGEEFADLAMVAYEGT
jgi:HEAT repeat protein